MHFTCCAVALEGDAPCKHSGTEQSRPKQGNAVETSAIRPPPAPHPQEPVLMPGYTSAPNSCRPSSRPQGTCRALRRLKGLQTNKPTHRAFFSSLLVHLLSPRPSFSYHFSSANLELAFSSCPSLDPLALPSFFVFYQFALGIALFIDNLTKQGTAALMLSPHQLGDPYQRYLPRPTEIHPGGIGTAKTAQGSGWVPVPAGIKKMGRQGA